MSRTSANASACLWACLPFAGKTEWLLGSRCCLVGVSVSARPGAPVNAVNADSLEADPGGLPCTQGDTAPADPGCQTGQ